MKLSYNWIKEHVDISDSPETLAEKLTMTGSEVGSIEKVGDDTVMELEITSNRPDCLSMLGLSREAAAVSGADLNTPYATSCAPGKGAVSDMSVKCSIKAPELCPRYTARVIRGVTVGEVSAGISGRIGALGVRPVNNIVDVTNFCLFESGQPMHAFDLDKIKGGVVEVREAAKGEKIITIDGVERSLESGMLVIADKERPIAVAGIMGGKDTEVTSSTTNILLESAYFDPVSVRRTSRKLGLTTDSSYRFERGVDTSFVMPASERATSLIIREAGGKAGGLYDSGPYGSPPVEIHLDIGRASGILGISLDQEEVIKILKWLGMEVFSGEAGSVKVRVPSFRGDVSREIDLVEEIARIHGFGGIPDTVPRPAPWTPRKTRERKVLEKTKKILCSLGLSEIMTYSLISEEAARTFPGLCDEVVKIMNPLSAEHETLTPHLMDGMLKVISWNINRANKDLKLFEVGKKYSRVPGKAAFRESHMLAVGITGNVEKNWAEGEKQASLYSVKGVLERTAECLRTRFDIEPTDIEGFVNAAEISAHGVSAGFIGEVSPDKLEIYGISQKVFVSQVDLREVFSRAVLIGAYSPIPKFPFSTRDLSVLCDRSVTVSSIRAIADALGGDLLRKTDVVDMYEGKQIPPDKKSVTFSFTYGLLDRTLTDEEVEEAHSRIKEGLVSKLGVTFR